MPTDFTFDRGSQRYRNTNTGKFVSAAKVRQLTIEAIRIAEDETLQVADLLIEGKISISEWQLTTAKTLKNLHIQQYLLGRGGQKMITADDRDIISNKLQQEFKYLDQFGKDIKVGMSQAQFESRLNLYLNNGRTTYELGRRQGFQQAGYNWERRRLGAAEHCSPCVGFAGLGWQPIGALPNVGADCDCRANCKCFFEYAQEKPDRFMPRMGWIGSASLNI